MASKFDKFLKASWNTFFSTKKRQESRQGAASPRMMESARAQWGGFRRGKTDVQTPRRVAVRNLALEGLGKFEEDLVIPIQHAVPSWAAD